MYEPHTEELGVKEQLWSQEATPSLRGVHSMEVELKRVKKRKETQLYHISLLKAWRDQKDCLQHRIHLSRSETPKSSYRQAQT